MRREIHSCEEIDEGWVSSKAIVNGIGIQKDHQVRFLAESLLQQLKRFWDIAECKINLRQVGGGNVMGWGKLVHTLQNGFCIIRCLLVRARMQPRYRLAGLLKGLPPFQMQ